MRKKFLGILCIIIGAVLLTSAWVLTHILVGGEQEGRIQHPHTLNVPLPLFIFLFFGGIGLIIVGVLWFIQMFRTP